MPTIRNGITSSIETSRNVRQKRLLILKFFM